MELSDYGYALSLLPDSYGRRQVDEVGTTVYGDKIVITTSAESSIVWNGQDWTTVYLN